MGALSACTPKHASQPGAVPAVSCKAGCGSCQLHQLLLASCSRVLHSWRGRVDTAAAAANRHQLEGRLAEVIKVGSLDSLRRKRACRAVACPLHGLGGA